MTNYPLTLALMRWLVTVDGAMWSVVEVAMDGSVLLRRDWDAPEYARVVYTGDNPRDYETCDFPGVALHRWFPGSVLAECINSKWDR